MWQVRSEGPDARAHWPSTVLLSRSCPSTRGQSSIISHRRVAFSLLRAGNTVLSVKAAGSLASSVAMVRRSEQGEALSATATRHCTCGMSASTGQAQNPLALRYWPRNRPGAPVRMTGCACSPPCTRWNRWRARLAAGMAGEKPANPPE